MNNRVWANILDYKKYAITALLVVLIAFSYSVKQVKAVTQTTLSGTCGILANFNYNGWNGLIASNLPNMVTKSAIGTINFDTGIAAVDVSVMTNYGDTTFGSMSETVAKSVGTLAFTSFDTDTGLYKYTMTDNSNGQQLLFSILPVNSSNTFLISGQVPTVGGALGPTVSGICQKV